MTYQEAITRLGAAYTQHLYRQPKLEDCLTEVEGLEQGCRDVGLTERANAYATIAKAIREMLTDTNNTSRG